MRTRSKRDIRQLPLDEVKATLRDYLPEIQSRYGVRGLWLFGSFVRGQARRSSDLDVLVEFDDRPLSLLDFVALEMELSDLLGVKVDLVQKGALKPFIGARILAEAVPL